MSFCEDKGYAPLLSGKLVAITEDIDNPEKKLAAAFELYVREVDLQSNEALIVYQASKSLDKASKIRAM